MEFTFYPLVVIIQYVPGYNFSDSVMAAVRGIYRKFEAFFSGMGPTSTTHVNLLHSAATFGHLPMNSYHSHLYTTTHKQVSACSQDLVGECQCVLH